MADKIEAELRGAGSRVLCLHDYATNIGPNEAVRRLAALELAILSRERVALDGARSDGSAFKNPTEALIYRAEQFELYLRSIP